MRGKARSLAPSISGIRKFPSVAGIEGMRKKNTMMTPCMVKTRLYTSDVIRSPAGVSSSRRTSSAKKPPRKNMTVIENRYSSPIRL